MNSRRFHLALAATLFAAPLLPPVHAQPAAPLTEEVPFITTPDQVTLAMLRLAEVGPQDHLIDLGSGDGRIVITAARQFGASGVGVEIVPDLVRKSVDAARQAGVAERTSFRVQDIFETDLGKATVVTMYLLPEFNLRLRPSLLKLAPGTRIVSHDWDMGDWKPDRTVQVDVPDKAVGLEKFSRVHLWRVPAPVGGLWCAAGGHRLRITQDFQNYEAQIEQPGGRVHRWKGRIQGTELPPPVGGAMRPAMQWADGALRVKAGAGGVPNGTRFERTTGTTCAG